MKNKKFTIRMKITLIFTILLVFFIVSGIFSYSSFTTMQTESKTLALEVIPIKETTDNLLTDLINEETAVRGYLVTAQPSYLQPYNDGKKQVANDLAFLRKTDTNYPVIKKLIDSEAAPKINDIQSYFDQEIHFVQIGKIDDARNTIGAEKKLMDEFRQIVSKIDNTSKQLQDDFGLAINNTVYQSKIIIIIATIVVALFARVFGFILIRSIVRPLSIVAKQMKDIADGEGDLTKQVKVQTKDEILDLANAFNQMLGNLRNIIGQVKLSTEQVAASSEQLLASAEQTNQATEHIATTMQELADSSDKQASYSNEGSIIISQMYQDVIRISENADNITSATTRASDVMEQGNQAIQSANEQMETIHSKVDETASIVKILGAYTQQIDQIVEVITGIAGQTNLLALNAAIEAARAGEKGRGFAVVADEVRKLAEQSGQSAGQIGEFIRKIQTETMNVMKAMEESIEAVSGGIYVMNEAKTAFGQIHESIQEVTSLEQAITQAVQTMTQSTEEIVYKIVEISTLAETGASGVQNVSAAAQEQLASMEEITASSNYLATMAEDLQELISKFKV